jgi:polyisoprenoid-binding protein YceI
VIGVIVIGYGAIFLYAKVLNDSPDELDSDDLAAALSADATSSDDTPNNDGTDTPTAPATSTAPSTAPSTATSTPPANDAVTPTTAPTTTPDPVVGAAYVVTDASELGYRVKEILFGVDTEAVGRTNQITGTLTIDGSTVTDAQFTVDVASISSDEGRRDGQFRGRIMSTDEFPNATFVLTEPIDLGTEPVDGAAVQATATGELTLRGVTNTVTFEVAAQQDNGKIGVLGNIPVVFADYSIANPSTGGITTEDEGLLEFVLVFEPV